MIVSRFGFHRMGAVDEMHVNKCLESMFFSFNEILDVIVVMSSSAVFRRISVGIMSSIVVCNALRADEVVV